MKCIKDRRSIRKYKQISIDRSTIERILQAGTLAPSAKNRQPWKFIVYMGDSKEKLCSAMEKGLNRESRGYAILPESAFGIPDAYNTLKIMQEAPVLIIVLNTNGQSPYKPISTNTRISEINDTLSIGAAIENIILEAQELGLGTLWIGNTCFAYPELVNEIGTTNQVVCAISLGIPNEMPMQRPRKNISEVVEFKK